jgi:hypothetical protein
VVRGESYGAASLSFALIHPTAWNRNSANFACKEFSEIRYTSSEASPLGDVPSLVIEWQRIQPAVLSKVR